jgi:hypothetical protein
MTPVNPTIPTPPTTPQSQTRSLQTPQASQIISTPQLPPHSHESPLTLRSVSPSESMLPEFSAFANGAGPRQTSKAPPPAPTKEKVQRDLLPPRRAIDLGMIR